MKFKYKKYSQELLRPIIPIEIIRNGNKVRYEVLVDSGADICILDSEIAEILEIEVKKGIKQQVLGVTGFLQDLYLHTVTINVGGIQNKLEVGFMNMNNQSYGIVGQKDFFKFFVIKFDLLKEEIELKPRTKS